MVTILDGRIVRDKIQSKLKGIISGFGLSPKLAIIQIGDREDSNAYIAQKKKFAETIGVVVQCDRFPKNVSKEEVVRHIQELNKDSGVHGIIVQLPVPQAIDAQDLIEAIVPSKDVDGLTSTNLKLLWTNKPDGFMPATAKGIITLLDNYQIPLKGKKITVVGRSVLVGKPAVLAALNRDATVTVCHSETCNLSESTKTAEILIVAIGQPKIIGPEYVSSGQVVVDVGINTIAGESFEEEIDGKKFVGDVDFEKVKNIVGAITPVPGGVGPMTVASLFQNLLRAYENQVKN